MYVSKNTQGIKPRITSDKFCITASISQDVDQPPVKELKSHFKDSADFIKKVHNLGKIRENNTLEIIGVRALYANIPYKEGIRVVQATLKRKRKPTSVVIPFLELIRTLNNFIFNCKNHLQIKRYAHGNWLRI